MKCWDTLTVTPPGGQGRRHAEGRDETPALPYSGHCTSEVCLNMAATEGARRRERCRHCVVRVPERRGEGEGLSSLLAHWCSPTEGVVGFSGPPTG